MKQPAFELTYNNQDATYDIAQHLIDARYTDSLMGESDELEITLEDTEEKWMDTWLPEEGAMLRFKIGYAGEALLDCGQFEIDEIEVSDSPNTVRIRALSAGINTPQRTRRFRAYDDKTLAEIVHEVAGYLGFKVEGVIQPLKITRITQKETDLAFLKRLADEYGYVLKIKGDRLIFSNLKKLKSNDAIKTLRREEKLRGARFRKKVRRVHKQATVVRQNPKTKALVEAKKTAPGKTSSDSLISRSYSDNNETAQAKADAKLERTNDERDTGSVPRSGDTELVAGATVRLSGYKKFDGKCLVRKATHSIDRYMGYVTRIDFIRIDN